MGKMLVLKLELEIDYQTIKLGRAVEKNTVNFFISSHQLRFEGQVSQGMVLREREAASVSGMWFFTIAPLPHNVTLLLPLSSS